jgi:hypothetical protein
MLRALCRSSSGTSTVLVPLVYKHLWRPPMVPSELHLVGDLLLVILRCTVPWILNLLKFILALEWRCGLYSNYLRRWENLMVTGSESYWQARFFEHSSESLNVGLHVRVELTRYSRLLSRGAVSRLTVCESRLLKVVVTGFRAFPMSV